jgi:hypothetical protein
MGLGLLFLLTGVFGLGSAGVGVFGAMLAVVVVLFVYSYFVWRADPEKQAPGAPRRGDDV